MSNLYTAIYFGIEEVVKDHNERNKIARKIEEHIESLSGFSTSTGRCFDKTSAPYVKNPLQTFKEGDDYYTVEDGEVVKSCWDDVSIDDFRSSFITKRMYKYRSDAALALKQQKSEIV
jgi:hypothetical protein